MQLKSEQTKKERICRILENEIQNHHLEPGERLASRREMADRFGCSDAVINEVCNLLEDRKLIIRKPKSGTYVNPQLKFGPARLAVLVLEMETENFENYISTFLQQAEENGMLPMICRVTPATFADTINRIRKRSPERLLLDLEARRFPLELVRAVTEGLSCCFVNRWEWQEPPVNAVLTDYISVYEEGLSYLHKNGARKILFLNAHRYLMPFRQKIMEQLQNGICKRLNLTFLPFSFEELQNDPKQICRFSGQQLPDAVFGTSDYYLAEILHTAEKYLPALRKLPRAGVFNMSYSTFPGHEFSSVPLNLEEMWNKAFALNEKKKQVFAISAKPIIIRTKQ